MHLRTYSNRYKTLLVLLISFSLYFNGFSTAYAASLGGWSIGTGIVNGASVVYSATKNLVLNGVTKVATGTATITPTALQVSKVLGTAGAAVALDLAIKAMLGSVDYVLDSANNTITYTKKSDDLAKSSAKAWHWNNIGYYTSASSACSAVLAYDNSGAATVTTSISSSGTSATCYLYNSEPKLVNLYTVAYIDNPNYDPTAEDESKPKTVPLSNIAQKVIEQAAAGNATSQQVIQNAADTIVQEAENDDTKARPIVQQLESSQSIPTEQTATGQNTTTDATTSDITLDFPVFCNWAPTVCQAANVVIQKPSEWAESIKAAYDDAVDYFKEELEDPEQETPDIPDPTLDLKVTNYIQGTSVCPQDREISLSMGGKTLNLVISYQPLCSVAEMFKPAVILMAFLAGVFIITNTGRRAETGD